MTVLDIVFFKALVIGNEHTAVGHQKTRHQADGSRQQQKNHKIFPDFTFQFPQQSLAQRIFHLVSPKNYGLPFQLLGRNLFRIAVISSNHAVPKLHHPIGHILDGIVVGHHDDRIAVFLIDGLDELQDIL